MSGTKIFVGTTIGAGAIWLAYYLFGKKKVGDKLNTVTSASVHSIKLTGLTLRIDVILKNPTEYGLRLKQPYVKVLFKDKVIGTSEIKNSIIEIPKYGVKSVEPIFITIPATGLLTLGDGLFKFLVKKEPATITTITTTSIQIGGKFISYEKPDVITLKPKA